MPDRARSCGFKSGRSGAMCSAPNKSNNKGGRRAPLPPPGAGAAGGPGGGPRPAPAPHHPPLARTYLHRWPGPPLRCRCGAPAPSRRSLFADAGPGPAPPPARRRPSLPSSLPPPAPRRAGPLPAAAVSGASLFSAARGGKIAASGRGSSRRTGMGERGACPFKNRRRDAPDRVTTLGRPRGRARLAMAGGGGGTGEAARRVPRDQACHAPQPSWRRGAGPPRGAAALPHPPPPRGRCPSNGIHGEGAPSNGAWAGGQTGPGPTASGSTGCPAAFEGPGSGTGRAASPRRDRHLTGRSAGPAPLPAHQAPTRGAGPTVCPVGTAAPGVPGRRAPAARWAEKPGQGVRGKQARSPPPSGARRSCSPLLHTWSPCPHRQPARHTQLCQAYAALPGISTQVKFPDTRKAPFASEKPPALSPHH